MAHTKSCEPGKAKGATSCRRVANVLRGPCALIECGVDYFTTTATSEKSAKLLAVQADGIGLAEELAGNFKRPWSMKRYQGWQCGQVEFGVREDSVITRLSGSLATER